MVDTPYRIEETYRDGGVFVFRYQNVSEARIHLRALIEAHPARTYVPIGFDLRPAQ